MSSGLDGRRRIGNPPRVEVSLEPTQPTPGDSGPGHSETPSPIEALRASSRSPVSGPSPGARTYERASGRVGARDFDLEPPRLIDQSRDHVLGTWHHLVVVIWKHETTMVAIAKFAACAHSLAIERQAPLTILGIVEEQAALPSTEARTALAQLLRNAPLKASGMVFEGDGFAAAAVRGVITGISLLARPRYPHRTLATVAKAAEWFEEQTKGGWSGCHDKGRPDAGHSAAAAAFDAASGRAVNPNQRE